MPNKIDLPVKIEQKYTSFIIFTSRYNHMMHMMIDFEYTFVIHISCHIFSS